MKTVVVFIFILLALHSINSQDLESFKWKNRLLLVLTPDLGIDQFKKQIALLQTDSKGLKERKLLIFKILPNTGSTIENSNDNWIYDSDLYKDYTSDKNQFKVVLIGLDGGIKHEQDNTISLKKLYNLIDRMPMRRAELRKN